jgi:hypothetical protein
VVGFAALKKNNQPERHLLSLYLLTTSDNFEGDENKMKKLMAICFAMLILTFGIASAQDTMKSDTMKADTSKKAVNVTGKISEDGKKFVSDSDSKSWTIVNPEAVKGHEGHHVTLTAHANADKSEVHVVSLKMAK